MAEYTRGEKRLHMAYSFEMLGDAYTPRHFRKAVEIAPTDESALFNLSRAQELAGDLSGTLDTCAAILQLYPQNVEARNRAAMILAQRGHPEAALEQWSASLAINPAQPDVLNNLGALAI